MREALARALGDPNLIPLPEDQEYTIRLAEQRFEMAKTIYTEAMIALLSSPAREVIDISGLCFDAAKAFQDTALERRPKFPQDIVKP